VTDQLQTEINQYWNQQAAKLGAEGTPHHNVRDDAQRRVWLDVLRPVLPPPPADVLDVGTGTGFLALHHWTMRAGATYSDTLKAAFLEKSSLQPGLTRNDPQFTEVLVGWLGEAGFVDVKTTHLEDVDRFEAAHGSDHLGWLALTAVKPA
jgi:SAM-dependent methyltransferase